MRLTRRTFLGGAAAAAVGGGIYELVDRLGSAPARPLAEPAGMPAEQHLLDLATTHSEGVEVVVPPLHSAVVTANLDNLSDLRGAQRQLEDVLRRIDSTYALTPAGLGVTVAWSQTYFDTYVSTQAKAHLPYDRRAQKSVLVPTRRFPSDPANTILEANDVAVLFRSDRVEHIEAARKEIFDLPFFTVASIRRGFAGGGFGGGQSLPKKMAVAAGVPGADLIPDGSELFLGFTSTQKAGLGPGTIANHETLGYVDLRSGYFRNGTHMHLSHISEDLEAWYLNFDFDERVLTAFRPGMTNVRQGMQTVPQGPAAVSPEAELVRQFHKTGRFGHSASIQATSRLLQDTVGEDGTHYPKGTAIPQRADFNTLDNPFAFSADPKGDGLSNQPAAGVHFVVFNPSGDDFERNRLAMDGVFPGGKKLPVAPRNRAAGFNSVLTTTHRQNFLVPPRRHRSLPLVEL
ncbi:MAG TPA: twin-arginine translocation signal domain-containing protein [Gaiellaceae bacterium]